MRLKLNTQKNYFDNITQLYSLIARGRPLYNNILIYNKVLSVFVVVVVVVVVVIIIIIIIIYLFF